MTTEYTPNFGLAMPDFRMGPWHDLVNGNTATIDALLFSALSNTNVVAWENDTDYVSGISVVDSVNATIWLCVESHTSPPEPKTFAEDRADNPDRWTQLIAGFAPRGEWQNGIDYFPYDLSYSDSQGIFALCTLRHTSNVSGTLKDDEAYWVFLVDMSEASISTALAVTYDNTASGLDAENVQSAIDELHADDVLLNNVNVAQGDRLTALEAVDIALDTRLDAVETLNASQSGLLENHNTRLNALEAGAGGIDATYVKLAGGQQIQGGYSVASKDLGNLTNFMVNMHLANYQYGNNVGPITITAPNTDGGVDLLITNQATAGGISFSGFTVNAANIGDQMTTTPGHRFLVSMRRIGGIATYAIKALQ